jgi:dTDP-4-dehydrorhamnose reductase
MSNVFAVILTYNRSALLKQCVRAIACQTHRCDRIIVIDNASTDDTLEVLKSEGLERLTIMALPKNVGAAGGFNLAMHYAYQEGADYIWLMDDDVIPEEDALLRLLEANSTLHSRKISPPFLISNARSPDGLPTNTPEIDNTLSAIAYSTWPLLLDKCMVPVNRATFVSILLPRETIKQYGLPIADFFIWGEDVEFTLRITRNGPGYIVGDSRVVHVRAQPGALDIKKEQNPTRIRYFYYLKRNQMFVCRRLRQGSAITFGLRQLWLTAELILRRDFAKAKLVLTGTVHGLFFNPRREEAQTESSLQTGTIIENPSSDIVPQLQGCPPYARTG